MRLPLVGGQADAAAAVAEGGYATMSDWFFQMVFVATAATVSSPWKMRRSVSIRRTSPGVASIALLDRLSCRDT